MNETYLCTCVQKRQTTIQQPDPAQIPVVRPFDPNGFHFNKASPREIMMKLTLGQNPTVVLAALQEENQQQEGTGGDGGPETDEEQAIHTLFVNVSPLAHGHSLLVPWMEEMLPQRLTKASIILSLRLCRLSKREDFKIGYNSLGAFASVNHLHFQPFYTCLSFDKPGMPVEYSEKLRIYPTDDDNGSGNGTVHIHALTNWPISGWVFTLVADSIDDGKLQYLGIQVNELVQRLITLDVAHNLLFCDGGRSVYILPRKKQRVIGKDYVRIAMIEASGLAVCRDEEAFQVRFCLLLYFLLV